MKIVVDGIETNIAEDTWAWVNAAVVAAMVLTIVVASVSMFFL